MSIQYMLLGLELTTFGHESPPITTRPGLIKDGLFKTFKITKSQQLFACDSCLSPMYLKGGGLIILYHLKCPNRDDFHLAFFLH